MDERTDEMSEAALLCRAVGHTWMMRGMTRRRYRELIAEGLWEFDRYCENGCGSTWRVLFRARDGEILENERRYPTGGSYLMKPGSGRLHRNSARAAHVARQFLSAPVSA